MLVLHMCMLYIYIYIYVISYSQHYPNIVYISSSIRCVLHTVHLCICSIRNLFIVSYRYFLREFLLKSYPSHLLSPPCNNHPPSLFTFLGHWRLHPKQYLFVSRLYSIDMDGKLCLPVFGSPLPLWLLTRLTPHPVTGVMGGSKNALLWKHTASYCIDIHHYILPCT